MLSMLVLMLVASPVAYLVREKRRNKGESKQLPKRGAERTPQLPRKEK